MKFSGLNPFAKKKIAASVPRVDTGAPEEEVEALQSGLDLYVRERYGYLSAMMRLGKPIAASTPTKRKRSKTTAHVRRKRAHMARSAYLRSA